MCAKNQVVRNLVRNACWLLFACWSTSANLASALPIQDDMDEYDTSKRSSSFSETLFHTVIYYEIAFEFG